MNIPNFQQFEYSDVCNRHANGCRVPYYNKGEVDRFFKNQPNEACMKGIINHNDAVVEIAHTLDGRVYELEKKLAALEALRPGPIAKALEIVLHNSQRIAFEKWAENEGLNISNDDGVYWHERASLAWRTWLRASGVSA